MDPFLTVKTVSALVKRWYYVFLDGADHQINGLAVCLRIRPSKANAYPSATSSVIITLKPTAKNTVPRLECRPCDISGISSSTTT